MHSNLEKQETSMMSMMMTNNVILKSRILSLLVIAAAVVGTTGYAADPIIQTNFTADPAPLVYKDTVYLYTGHDEDDAPAGQGRFLMRDWKCYSSTDMVNWTDHGTVVSLKTFPWAVQENDAWASQAIERNGKFYFYATASVPGWPKNVIAVAVADNPLGPFSDPLGRPLIDKKTGYIDPSVLIDDDGQAYLYWGNPNLWYVKLNEDMISYSGEIVQEPTKPANFQEGPWAYKRDGRYYMAYASTCCPEGIGYAMSDSPTGPWVYKGYIVPPDRRSTGNHPGIIDYKGSSYVFGFNYKLNFAITKQHHERRSVCVAKMEFNPDGTIQELPWWEEAQSVSQIGTLDPYVRHEAETIAWSEGIKSEPCSQGGMSVYPTRDGAYIKVQGVDFGTEGAGTFMASVALDTESGAKKSGVIELHLDKVDGPLIGTVPVSSTSVGWKSETVEIRDAAGVRDLYFVFKGDANGKHFKFDYWQFSKKAGTPPLAGLNAAVDRTFNQNSVQTPKQAYQPTLESLEKSNPAPEWFKDAKFGIYFHWGVYSVPAFSNEWYPRNMYKDRSTENRHHVEKYGPLSEWPYDNFITGANDKQGNFVQFAPKLKSEGGQFDPEEWAQLFADAGAKFAGPVAEHHDGFSMWASKVNPWNAKDMGPKLDLVGLLTEAIRKRDMKIILSMHHAYNITGFYDAVPKTDDPKLQMLYGQQGKEKNEAFWLSKHQEIIDTYRPDIIWQDFNLHIISRPVLLEFLAYYYNKAMEWNKEVVATYKDGLNPACAVLDYERGGPADITENYWLTDDAISSSSWCYTEGIGYYSRKQVLHGFLDRISKNGNLLLNISPKADGSIPGEQKEILLTMGAWLKKYGEAVYATRAWEKYGEGPTKMGGAHGQMGPPREGTAGDVRYTRSKDSKTLYAILLGWEQGQQEVILQSLSSERIDGQKLKSVELINGRAGEYLPLVFKQDKKSLTVRLPERSFEELAYVLKLNFEGGIPPLDKYADIDSSPHYYIVPANSRRDWVLGSDFKLTNQRKEAANQWKLEPAGKGIYKIVNRRDPAKGIETSPSGNELVLSEFTGKDSQLWKFDDASNEVFTISSKQNTSVQLSLSAAAAAGSKAVLSSSGTGSLSQWKLEEVCELKQQAFKPHVIPGTIEAEDFDTGCPGDAFYDRDEVNEGGQYRLSEGIDIEKCTAGGHNVGWTRSGEWMAYTVKINKTAAYRVSFYVASAQDTPKLHLECDGSDITGTIPVPNTGGFQNWQVVTKTINLEAGERLLKFVIDGDQVNLDKIIFEEME